MPVTPPGWLIKDPSLVQPISDAIAATKCDSFTCITPGFIDHSGFFSVYELMNGVVNGVQVAKLSPAELAVSPAGRLTQAQTLQVLATLLQDFPASPKHTVSSSMLPLILVAAIVVGVIVL